MRRYVAFSAASSHHSMGRLRLSMIDFIPRSMMRHAFSACAFVRLSSGDEYSATAAAAAAAKTAAIDEMAAVIAAMRLEPPTAGVDQMEQSALFESPSAPDTDSDDSDDGDDSDDSDVAKRLHLDDLV